MVMFTQVDPADLNTDRLGRRGRVSYPILKAFMEANIKCAKPNIDELGKNPAYLRSVLTSYINSHNLPIKLFSAGGVLHLMRTDLDNDGKPIEDPNRTPMGMKSKLDVTTAPTVEVERPTEGAAGHLRDIEARPIDAAEVAARFSVEKGLMTK